jgi:CRISPR system Cascade subunit CasB
MPPDAPAASDAHTEDDAAPSLGRSLGKIKESLHPDRLGTGPLAMLRRLDPGRPSAEPALHRLLAAHVPDSDLDDDGLARWTLIVHAMALAAPDGMRFGIGLGAPLFAAGYSEGRFTRLLEARTEELAIVVPRAVRFLMARGQALDPRALATFVRDLKTGGARAEAQRTRLARDYYRAEREAGRRAPPAGSNVRPVQETP